MPLAAAWLYEFELFTFSFSIKKDQVDSVTQFLRWVHVRSIELQVWGIGQQRVGYTMTNQEDDSYINEEVGYGIVGGNNDFGGW